jgi:hypothetical protein
MPDLASALRRTLAMMAGSIVIACIAAACASAATGNYGEITHFASKGSGEGQLEGEAEATDIGVEPTSTGNNVYTVDVPGKKAYESNEFRLQKFEEVGGKWQAVGSVDFTPVDDEAKEEIDDVIEGVVVDPTLHRVYVLASETRSEKLSELPGDLAAAEVYAFSTTPSGKTLVPAEGTKEGVLAAPGILHPLSTKPGQPLLEPYGLALDPQTHDLLILGEELTENPSTAKIAVQSVTSEGKLGSRWSDMSESLEDEADSIAVTPKTGKILLGTYDEIAEIPSSLSSSTPAKPFNELLWGEEREAFSEGLTTIPGSPALAYGGGLSVGPEGTVYTRASIVEQPSLSARYPGIEEFNESGQEIGWTGGQSPAKAEGCVIGVDSKDAQIAAGNERVFVFDDEYHEETGESTDEVLEFGKGGGGCPKGSATQPVVKVGEPIVHENEPIPITEKVTFASTLTQANAISVEWEFGDGTTATSSGREYEHTEVTHEFKTSGTLTVKERIHTDNLETPTLETQVHVTIVSAAPIVTIAPPKEVGETTATLTGSVNPQGVQVSECMFEWGLASETGKFPNKAECASNPGSGKAAVAVLAKISGLTKTTGYHYRLRAVSAKGPSTSKEEPFTTGPFPPAVTTVRAEPSLTTATLTGVVNANGEAIESCYFEYGASSVTEKTVPCSPTPSGSTPVSVSASISGLSPGTEYSYTLVAKSAAGTTQGSVLPFKTLAEESPPPPPPPPPSPGPPQNESHEVLGAKYVSPTAKIASTSVSVSSSGSFTIKVSCAAGSGQCSGSVTLKTAKAVVASIGHAAKTKASILTLASASFTVSAGTSKTITLHLSSKARALLAKTHSVLARAAIASHGPTGLDSDISQYLTLRPAKAKPKAKGKH